MRKEQTEIEEIFVGAPLTTRELKRFFEEQKSLDFILSKSSLDDSVEYSNLIRISAASGYYMRFYSKEGQLSYRFTIKEDNNMGGRGGSSGESAARTVSSSYDEISPSKPLRMGELRDLFKEGKSDHFVITQRDLQSNIKGTDVTFYAIKYGYSVGYASGYGVPAWELKKKKK